MSSAPSDPLPGGNRTPTVVFMAAVGELVHTKAGKWITHPPSRCPNGHRLGPGEVLVGHQVCLGHGGGQTVYGPPLNTHCSCLDGPAVVHISNATARDSQSRP